MPKSFFFLMICFLMASSIPVKAQMEPDAIKAFQEGDYELAILLFEQLREQGHGSADLYYNLGSAYFRSGKIGKAILNFERARVRAPLDSGIRHNLEMVEKDIDNPIEPIPPFFLAQWATGFRDLLPVSGWAILGLLVIWVAVIFWTLVYFKKIQWRRLNIRLLVGLGFGLGIFFQALAWLRFESIYHSDKAVILEKNVPLRYAPEEQSGVKLNLSEGTRITLEDQIGNWEKVRLGNGETGWLLPDGFEKI